MPRIAWIVATEYPHHIVLRGNNRVKVFEDKEDFKKYLSLDYPYSSARTHILEKSNVLPGEPLFDKGEISNYRKFIAGDEGKVDLDVIRKQTRLGKPLGDRGFLEMLSKKLGYKLNFRSKGRPKKGMCP